MSLVVNLLVVTALLGASGCASSPLGAGATGVDFGFATREPHVLEVRRVEPISRGPRTLAPAPVAHAHVGVLPAIGGPSVRERAVASDCPRCL
jgi:hypothetical protein